MPYQDIVIEDQRLVILRTLEETNHSANDSIMQKVLSQYGHNVTRDQIKSHYAWLQEQGLIRVETIASTHVAHLTSRGHDIAQGRGHVPGVGKPGPKG
ncbi:Uncharacterised protein [BD1-7 clade bacterium]|uniref:Uncharacterized protein n=1 Tax=BD1-7 clade bacterium TaxID=2029982 RepID=A0A5S9Q2E3_9GAMM|nr:Uncharacterised protein [BD1-7 clade bacterium]CAA0111720.1 Uncharacterised protein [BD1-7 clade bacterium]